MKRTKRAFISFLLPFAFFLFTFALGAAVHVEEATLYKLQANLEPGFILAEFDILIEWLDAGGMVLSVDEDRLEKGDSGYRLRRELWMSPLRAGQVRLKLRLAGGGAAVESDRLALIRAYEILDNGLIRVGVNGTLGGAIDYLATSARPEKNYVNRYDAGRLIQKSFMGPPYTYFWPGLPDPGRFPWNPCMGGYWERDKKLYSGAVCFEKEDGGRTVHVVCQPITFGARSASDLAPERTESTLETWITLLPGRPVVRIESRFLNSDTVDHAQWRDQELLAVYVTTDLNRLWSYTGASPWQGAPLTLLDPPQNPIHYEEFSILGFEASECFAAWTDAQNFGVAAYAPDAQQIGSFRYGDQGIGDDLADETNEFSIVPRFSVPTGSVRRDTGYVILDRLDGIRAAVYDLEKLRLEKREALEWRFIEAGNRGGWSGGWEGPWDAGRNAIDDSPGVQGGRWAFRSRPGITPWIVGPQFQRQAAASPWVEIRMATSFSGEARLYWNRIGDPAYSFVRERSKAFSTVGDGQMRTYKIAMNEGPDAVLWSGIIRQLRIEGFAAGDGRVEIESISLHR